MKRINGFSRKLHHYQLISYFSLLIFIFSYFFIIFPLSSTTLKIVGATLESIFFVIVVVSGFLATATDPSDSFLVESLKAKHENKPYTAQSKDFFCNVDLAYVHESSKHCKRCNRCTEDFDHHCKWINNDVGKKNYKSFFVMITGVMLFLLTYLATAIVLTVHFAKDSSLMDNDIFLYNNDSDQIRGAMIALWVILGFCVILLVLDTNLVLFHVFLIKKGLTTFQYIVATEERKEYKKELERARKILGEKNRTWLDFVLCLEKKNKKKKKTKNGQKPYITGGNETPNDSYPKGSEYDEKKRRNLATISELSGGAAERVKSRVGSYNGVEETRNEEHGGNEGTKDKNESFHFKDSDGILTLNRNLEKNVNNSVVVEEIKAEDEGKEMDRLEVLKTRKENKEIEEGKSPVSVSMNEFGDMTAVNNSRNRNVLNKSIHFESLKTLEDRRNPETQPVSFQIMDNNNLSQSGKEREISSAYHKEILSSPASEIEDTNLLKFGQKNTGENEDSGRKRIANYEFKVRNTWKSPRESVGIR